MLRSKWISVLAVANVLAFGAAATASNAGADLAESDGGSFEWCDADDSNYCRCVDGGPFLPSGCWEFDGEVDVDCFRQNHCSAN